MMTDPKVSPVSALVQRLEQYADEMDSGEVRGLTAPELLREAAAALRGGGSSPTGETPMVYESDVQRMLKLRAARDKHIAVGREESDVDFVIRFLTPRAVGNYPLQGQGQQGAAPSSSPAPSGRRHEDDER